MLGADTLLLDVSDANGEAIADFYALIAGTSGNLDEETDIVMIDGDFSFVTNTELHDNIDCSTGDTAVTDSSLVSRDEDNVVTEVKPVRLAEFLVPAGLYLCLTLSDEDDASSVPRTAPYTATFSYCRARRCGLPTSKELHTGWAASRATGPRYTCRI